MKCIGSAVAFIAIFVGNVLVHAARLSDTPMAKVVDLLGKMKTKLETEGKEEQTAYDNYATWCKDTLGEKADAIKKATEKIDSLQGDINKNKGFLGSGGATIGQLKKDMAENIESQKEATEVRKKENVAYAEEKASAEQCIGALEAAIKVLTGAGTKKGLLETLQEAKLLSVVASMKPVLAAPVAKRTVSDTDLKVVKHFVEKPEDFVSGPDVGSTISAMQIAHNPFGDYAPQSTQIQGILKNMYDSFTADLEKDNAEEGEKQKSFEELMATKKKELATLEASLEDETKSEAEKTKQVADDKAMRDDTQEQLDADKDFFADTKLACSEKARAWAQRSKLRSEELAGISKAIEILDSDDAKKTFKTATKLLEVSSFTHRRGDAPRTEAYKRLKSLATRFHSHKLAQIAVSVKTSGHFDDIMPMIDKMVALLREEEQEDIAHRDRCEDKQNTNKNAKADAEHEVDKHKASIERLEQAQKDKEAEIKEIEDSIKVTKDTMDDMAATRANETAEYKLALKADTDSIELLDEAAAALSKFYKDNGFVQVSRAGPVTLASAKPPPETFKGDYKGSQGESRGVLAILAMLKDDLEKEVKTEGQDEIDAQTAYEKASSALQKTYDAAVRSKTAAEVELADLKSDISDTSDAKDASEKDVADEVKLAAAIATDCDWVKSHFEKRRKSRKAEIDGLMDAKDFLAGVGTDSDLTMPE